MDLPTITPSIFELIRDLIFLTSSMEEIPPDIIKGIFTLLDNSIVSFIFGPFFVPSLLISV